jgi:NAD+ diphosphatase
MQRRNVFAGAYVDRAAHLRQDAAWFASALADAGSRVVPVWNSRSLIAHGETPRAAFPTLGEIADLRPDPDALVLLGRIDATNFFAYEIEGVDPPQLAGGARFEDLRLIASLLPPDEAGLLGYARAMISWRRRHRFITQIAPWRSRP